MKPKVAGNMPTRMAFWVNNDEHLDFFFFFFQCGGQAKMGCYWEWRPVCMYFYISVPTAIAVYSVLLHSRLIESS